MAADRVNARSPDMDQAIGLSSLQEDAHGLADRLPDLVLEAMRISSTVAHGIHGRRRAGQERRFGSFGNSGISTQRP